MKKSKLNLIDIITLIFITWSMIIFLIFRDKIPNAHYLFIFYHLYMIFILIFKKIYHKYSEIKIIIFIKYAYSFLLMGVLYRLIEQYVTVIHGGFLDGVVMNIQNMLFKTHLVLYLEKFINPVLTEIMKFSYFSYYFYIWILVFTLFFTKKYKEMEYSVFILALTYYVCYIGFVLFPVQGPRFTLNFQITTLKGYIFTSMQNWMMQNGQAIGACMPSSHLAVAWNTLFLIKKFLNKKLFYIMLPVTVLMSISIVYNRYHYWLDGAAGILTAFICFQAGKRIFKRYKGIRTQ